MHTIASGDWERQHSFITWKTGISAASDAMIAALRNCFAVIAGQPTLLQKLIKALEYCPS